MDSPNIAIHFCTVTGKEFTYEFHPNSTIYDVKKLLEKENHFQSEFLKLIHQAKILPDNQNINEINDLDKTTIFIHQSNLRAIRPTTPGPLPTGHLESDSIRVNHHQILDNSNQSESPRPSVARKMKNSVIDSENSHFTSLVKTLSDLGFDPEDCKAALHRSKNDINEAASLLLSQPSNQKNQHTINQQAQYENERDKLDSAFRNLTRAERDSVKNLSKLGYPIELITQVFIACDKNEQRTLECLETMQ